MAIKVKQYESSIMYRNIISTIEDGDLKQALEYLTVPPTKKQTSTISLIEILKQAHEEGINSEEFVETLKGAVRMYYQEMCDEGLIQQSTLKDITGIDPE
ncbi:MAG: hypothetical protein KBB91_02045 [Candidatus Pacebacteria bacterium]|nr:hypothetical protein [Candidatus Paceibacterota bacterium]